MTLNEISWSFTKEVYKDAEKFNQDVIRYQKDVYGDESNWIPDEVMFDSLELQIQYMAWIKDSSDLLENEVLFEEDEDIFEKEPDEGLYQVEIIAKLKANNGKNFTALEFLMKSHNQQANKELGDHVFFEGIDEFPEIVNGLPTYFIACGS